MDQHDLGGFWEAPREPGAVWQLDLFRLPMWLHPEEGEEPRLEMVWTALCLDLPTGEIAMSRIAGSPEASLAVGALPELARRTGYRPERIQVTDLEIAQEIRTALGAPTQGGGVEVDLCEEVRTLAAVSAAFSARFDRGDLFRLGETLHDAGRHEAAAEVLREVLRLDPLDPAKARYLLVDSLLHLGRHDDLEDLLVRYRDASAFWTWPHALLAFRREGDSPAAREHLRNAFSRNRFVPQALLDSFAGSPEIPRLVRTGSEEEAWSYATESRSVWKMTPGALEWLAAQWELLR